jgi:hypothetical protein
MRPMSAIGSNLPPSDPQREPNGVSGDRKGRVSVAERIQELHEVLQAGVAEYGGTMALANELGKSHTDVSLRVRRAADSKGQIQRASLDILGHVTADEKARLRVLFELMERWGDRVESDELRAAFERQLAGLCHRLGFEAPVRRRVVTPEDDAAECRAILESLPEPQRTAFRQERAKRLGVRLEDL